MIGRVFTPVIYMSPVLGAGYLRLTLLAALLPAEFTLIRGTELVRKFHLNSFISRRNLPYVKVPFRTDTPLESQNYVVRIAIMWWVFEVRLPRSSVRWSSSGKSNFFVEGQKIEVPWALQPTMESHPFYIGRGVFGQRLFASGQSLNGLSRQLSAFHDSSNGKLVEQLLGQLTLRGKDLTQPIWIIGNSPSVRVGDLDKIPNLNTTLAMNRFYLSYDSHRLREDILVSSDPLVIRDFGREMIHQSCGVPVFISGKPFQEAGTFVSIPLRKDRDEFFGLDLDHGMHPYGSTLIASLQIAMSLGFKRINLYGVDLSFVIKADSDGSGEEMGGENHFISGYRSSRPWLAPDWTRIQEGILACGIAAEASGVLIRNFTPGSHFDFFRRGDIQADIEI